MTIRPEDLLSGWRGRRFLVELALGSEALRADRDGTDAPLAQAVMSAASPETVAALLDRVHLADVDEDSALRDLADVVVNARYWQEPDGEDLLAATPAVRAALGRVAGHVAGSASAVGWWSEPVARGDQHAITWDAEASDPGGKTSGTAIGVAARLALWHDGVVEEERQAQQHMPTDPNASWSGEWWSTPPSDLTHTTRSLGRYGPGGLWLVEDGAGWERAVTRRVEVPAGARVYEVDRPDAWAELCRAYPLEVTAQKRHDWYRTTGRAGRWVIPDWAAIAVDHDGVHLTAAAYLSAAGTVIPVDGDTGSVIAGWNPDETYWLVDDVRPERDGAEWVLDDQDWVPAR